MSLTSIPIFCLISFGLTFMIKDSKIFSPLRKWLSRPVECKDCDGSNLNFRGTFFKKLFECSFCTGTWVGLGLSAIILVKDTPINHLAILEMVIIYSMLSALSSYALDLLTQKLESWTLEQPDQK